MIKAVLFDLDGTLLDTSEGIKHSVAYTISMMGYNALPEDTILKFVGPPIQNSLITYCGVSEQEAQQGANLFREFYKSNALFEASLYDGTLHALQGLVENNVKLGVATYKREDYAIELLKHFGIAEYCSVMHGADNENHLTKADIIDNCICDLNVGKDQVVLVGDTEHDAKGASEAGVKFIAVTWGFGYKKNAFKISYPYIGVAHEVKDINLIVSNY